MLLSYKDTKGRFYELNPDPLGKGMEGDVFRIIDIEGKVAKIFKPENRSPEREHKIRYQAAHPLYDYQEGIQLPIAWPLEVLYDIHTRQFSGYIMPEVKGRSLQFLCLNSSPVLNDPAWARFSFQQEGSMLLRMKVCYNLALAVEKIHAAGSYVLADMKPANILIQPQGYISIVDADSFQVITEEAEHFPARAFTPEFIPPEYQSVNSEHYGVLSKSWDRFSLAVICYQILTGVHPYTGSGHKGQYAAFVRLEDMIREGLYVHGIFRPFMGNIPEPHRRYKLLSDSIRLLFQQSFGLSGAEMRPAAAEFRAGFEEAISGSHVLPSSDKKDNKSLKFHVEALQEDQGIYTIHWQATDDYLLFIDTIGWIPTKAGSMIVWLENHGNLSLNVLSDNARSESYQAAPVIEPLFSASKKKNVTIDNVRISRKTGKSIFRAWGFLCFIAIKYGHEGGIVFAALSFMLGLTLYFFIEPIVEIISYALFRRNYRLYFLHLRAHYMARKIKSESIRSRRSLELSKERIRLYRQQEEEIFSDDKGLIRHIQEAQTALVDQRGRLSHLLQSMSELSDTYIEQARIQAIEALMPRQYINRTNIPALSAENIRQLNSMEFNKFDDILECRLSTGKLLHRRSGLLKVPGLGQAKIGIIAHWHEEIAAQLKHISAIEIPVQERYEQRSRIELQLQEARLTIEAILGNIATLEKKRKSGPEQSEPLKILHHKHFAELAKYASDEMQRPEYQKRSVRMERLGSHLEKLDNQIRDLGGYRSVSVSIESFS